jgi:salicylate hydroxylase
MRATKDLPVLVAGAGIGGLSAAIALSRRGIPVHVLEAEAEFGEVGAGLQIGPNAGRIITSWGLGERMSGISANPDYIAIKDGLTAKRLATMPLGTELLRRHGASYQAVERRALHNMLLNAAQRAPDIAISSGWKVRPSTATDTPVTIEAADGRTLTGRALVCADGVRSRLRAALFGREAVPTGKVAWRATASPSALSHLLDGNAVNLWMAPDTHLVLYKCGPKGPMNVVAVVDEKSLAEVPPDRDIPELLRQFAQWAPEVRDILTHFSGWIKWPLWGLLTPLEHWTKGAMTLVGDCAHPVYPFLASGAVMAIEDAETLAIEITRTPDEITSALQRYEARRIPRANRIVATSARMGEIYHMSGAMRLARNVTLAALPKSYLLARHDWLYGFRVTE